MPLNFVSSGGGSPFIRFSVEDNEWVRSTPEGDLQTVDMGSAPVLIDIENIQQGWLKLSGGRDWVIWPNNDPVWRGKAIRYAQARHIGELLFDKTFRR